MRIEIKNKDKEAKYKVIKITLTHKCFKISLGFDSYSTYFTNGMLITALTTTCHITVNDVVFYHDPLRPTRNQPIKSTNQIN